MHILFQKIVFKVDDIAPVKKILLAHRLQYYVCIFGNNLIASRGGLGYRPWRHRLSPLLQGFIGIHCMTMAIAISTYNLTPYLATVNC